MSKKKGKNKEHDILQEGNEKLNEAFSNAEHIFERYKIAIIGGVAVLLLVIGGWWAYNNLMKAPKEKKAKDAIVYAQKYFEIDSMQLALKGDGVHLGFEAVAKQYAGTPAGNRASFGAGVASLKLGKYAEAVKYLESFETKDPLLTARKFGCIADAQAELNQMDKAIENYKKAADAADNEVTAPTYLYRGALALELKGKKKEALELYKSVNAKYSGSQEGLAAEIAIAKLEAETF